MHTITPTLQSQQNFREEEDKKRDIERSICWMHVEDIKAFLHHWASLMFTKSFVWIQIVLKVIELLVQQELGLISRSMAKVNEDKSSAAHLSATLDIFSRCLSNCNCQKVIWKHSGEPSPVSRNYKHVSDVTFRSLLTCSCSSSSVGCLASGAGMWVGLCVRTSFCRPYTDWGAKKVRGQHKWQTKSRLTRADSLSNTAIWAEVHLYLSGFMRVFHSRRFLDVDFCGVHTSRLFEDPEEKQKTENAFIFQQNLTTSAWIWNSGTITGEAFPESFCWWMWSQSGSRGWFLSRCFVTEGIYRFLQNKSSSGNFFLAT